MGVSRELLGENIPRYIESALYIPRTRGTYWMKYCHRRRRIRYHYRRQGNGYMPVQFSYACLVPKRFDTKRLFDASSSSSSNPLLNLIQTKVHGSLNTIKELGTRTYRGSKEYRPCRWEEALPGNATLHRTSPHPERSPHKLTIQNDNHIDNHTDIIKLIESCTQSVYAHRRPSAGLRPLHC